MTKGFSEGHSALQTSNWPEGFDVTSSASQTNAVGQSHSERETAALTYGCAYPQAGCPPNSQAFDSGQSKLTSSPSTHGASIETAQDGVDGERS